MRLDERKLTDPDKRCLPLSCHYYRQCRRSEVTRRAASCYYAKNCTSDEAAPQDSLTTFLLQSGVRDDCPESAF